jgi:ketosteroid isomerase-like protein
MAADDLAQAIDDYHRSVEAFVRGDPGPQKRLYSHRDDATLANPLGPPARGWEQIEQTLDHAVSQLRVGETKTPERISGYATPELAYIVEIERTRAKIGDAEEAVSFSLRATTIFRREEEGWRIVHRHADAITAPRPIASVVGA